MRDTYFASPIRFDADRLRRQLDVVACSPVTDGVMRMVGGLIAVLNENRQILAVNEQLLHALKIDDPEKVFGLRPGEALGCVYAAEMAAGCGTSEYCMTCGAAIAIVTSLGNDWPVERNCAVSAVREGKPVDMFFRVHASPITIEEERFILLFLHDISRQQRLAALERNFFRDIRRTVSGIEKTSELLRGSPGGDIKDIVSKIDCLTMRLNREVEIQRILNQYQTSPGETRKEVVSVEWIFNEIEQLMENHPCRQQKLLQIRNAAPGLLLHTDQELVLMVLGNMLVNAFEATADYRTVRLSLATRYGHVLFSVWNAEAIPRSVAIRIFQRNFSTRDELGRGLGTFLMKLIGEQMLGGRVYFESTGSGGTTFYLELSI